MYPELITRPDIKVRRYSPFPPLSYLSMTVEFSDLIPPSFFVRQNGRPFIPTIAIHIRLMLFPFVLTISTYLLFLLPSLPSRRASTDCVVPTGIPPAHRRLHCLHLRESRFHV